MNESYMAVRPDGTFFGGKGGTQTGYRKINHLTSAMTHAGIKDKSGFVFIKLAFDEQMKPSLDVIERVLK